VQPPTPTQNERKVVPIRVRTLPVLATPIELALPSGTIFFFSPMIVAILRGLEERSCCRPALFDVLKAGAVAQWVVGDVEDVIRTRDTGDEP
jgi:hypothetical protein